MANWSSWLIVSASGAYYHAAQSGEPLRLEYATMLDHVPDFHSGYKPSVEERHRMCSCPSWLKGTPDDHAALR